MSCRRWVSCVAAGAAIAVLGGRSLAAQVPGLDPAIRVTFGDGVNGEQGELFRVHLIVTPPADAPGPLSVTLDGRGTTDGFVRRVEPTTFDCPLPRGCTPCPPGRLCYNSTLELELDTSVGPFAIPLTVTDALGRATTLAATLDVRPAVDRNGDGFPDRWQGRYDVNPASADGAPNADPDGDGVSNLEESRRNTNPRARYTRYFAEASSGDRPPGVQQCFAAAALTRDDSGLFSDVVWYTVVGDNGRRSSMVASAGDTARWVCAVDRWTHPADRVVATIIESAQPLAIERVVVTSDAAAVPFRVSGPDAPSRQWFFADGGADGELDAFYLTYNPGAAPVVATFTYRRDDGAVALRRTRVLAPGQRTTVWVNVDDAALGRVAVSTDITATAPILVERAWRADPPGRTVTQQLASPGTNDASLRWIFPEADGAAAFDSAIVIANPAAREALLDVVLLYGDRDERRAGSLRVPAGGRAAIPIRQLDGLAGTHASVEIVSANGVRVTAERRLSGHDGAGAWRHATIGARASAARWTIPSVSEGDLILTNVSSFPARVELHFYTSYSYSDDVVHVVDIPARRRLVYPLGVADFERFPWTSGTLRITSQRTERGTAEVVASLERYSNVQGVARARAAGLVATPVP